MKSIGKIVDKGASRVGLTGPARAGVLAACTLVAALPCAASAQEVDPDPRFWLEAGVYLPEADTEIGLFEADRSTGTLITLEDELGFDADASSVDVTFGAKLDDDFFTEGSFFAIRRNASVVLDEAIEVEDVLYDVGASVESEFSTDVYRWSIGYRIIANKSFELSALLGAHVTDFGFTVDGEGSAIATDLGDAAGELAATQIETGETVLAPLPVVGLQAKFRPLKWLELRARGDVFDIEIDAYDGRLVNYEASATAAITRNIAAGIAYRSTEYRINVNEDDFAADLEYQLDGLRAFVRLTI